MMSSLESSERDRRERSSLNVFVCSFLMMTLQKISTMTCGISNLVPSGDVDLLKEECRILKEECQTLKEENRRLSERLQLLQRQRTW